MRTLMLMLVIPRSDELPRDVTRLGAAFARRVSTNGPRLVGYNRGCGVALVPANCHLCPRAPIGWLFTQNASNLEIEVSIAFR